MRFITNTNEIACKLEQISKDFKPPVRNFILYENFGKHIFEVDLILKNIGEKGRILDVGGGDGNKFDVFTKINRRKPCPFPRGSIC